MPCAFDIISIHALVAESDLFVEADPDELWSISIHALLAESDWEGGKIICRLVYFYPRSPCGERLWPAYLQRQIEFISIHALLAESDG